ncbi:hypothetical protein EON64_15285 [archaeon]|nr:MAG: hypothetical protein EON64_15285 [archaeon]
MDAIMLLAGQASMLRVPSPLYRSHSAYETVHGLLPDIPPLTPTRNSTRRVELADSEDYNSRPIQARRPRALSEPWSMTEFAHMHAHSGSLHSALQPASSNSGGGENSVPDFVSQYAHLIHQHGRIGIYTKEERAAIVSRYREKRKRRVWQKKIRYTCRKSLADRRYAV